METVTCIGHKPGLDDRKRKQDALERRYNRVLIHRRIGPPRQEYIGEESSTVSRNVKSATVGRVARTRLQETKRKLTWPVSIVLYGVSETGVSVSQPTLVAKSQAVVTVPPCPLTVLPFDVQNSRCGEDQ